VDHCGHEDYELKRTIFSYFKKLTYDKLQIIARFCPLLLSGCEDELVNLLKDNNDIIKVGVLNVLAKAGATIRKQLSLTSRCCF
jgi:sister-chromatid-cohesion protein PDS5